MESLEISTIIFFSQTRLLLLLLSECPKHFLLSNRALENMDLFENCNGSDTFLLARIS